MPSTTRQTPAAEAWRLVHELVGPSRGWFLDTLRGHDLSPPQWHALKTLRQGVPTPMGDVAQALHCDNSNVTGIVDRLERRGLVERRPAEHDRRVKHLVITESGRALHAEIAAALAAGPNPLDALTTDDQRAVRDLLRKAVSKNARPAATFVP